MLHSFGPREEGGEAGWGWAWAGDARAELTSRLGAVRSAFHKELQVKYKGFRVAIIQLETGILVVHTNVEKRVASGEGGTEGIGGATSPSKPRE